MSSVAEAAGGPLEVDFEADAALSSQPSRAWRRLFQSGERVCRPARPVDASQPRAEGCVRLVCLSDTHGKLGAVLPSVPWGDVLLHAGDLTLAGTPEELVDLDQQLATLPHAHKLVIAGNHELCLDDADDANKRALEQFSVLDARQLLRHCTYLEDTEITVCGVRVFGSPWHSMPGYPFMRGRGAPLLERWRRIPAGVDVLITHMPPLGHGDLAPNRYGDRWGCVDLLNTVERRVRPRLHVFGHVHQGYGLTTNGVTTFVNASTCDQRYRPVNPPIVFDLPLRPHNTHNTPSLA